MAAGRILCAMCALAVMAGLAMPVSNAAEQVGVRAWAHPGHGRIVFDWPRAIRHEARIDGQVLTISFAEPLDASFASVIRNLQDYVSDIALDSSRATVTARLKSTYQLRTFTSGFRIVVDLVPQTAPPAGTTARPTAKPPAPPALRPPVQLTRPSSPPALSPPAQLTRPAAPLAPERAVRAAAPSVAARGAADPVPAAPATAAPSLLPIRAGSHPNYGRLVFEWASRTGFEIQREGQTVTIQFDAPALVDVDALRRALPRQIESAAVRPSARGLQLGLVVPPEAQLRYFHSGPRVVLDVVTDTERPASAAANAALPPRGADRPASKEVMTNKTESPPPDRLVSVEASRVGAQATLRFNWREPVNAAVFKRGTVLWIVFDKPARLELSAIRVTGRSLFDSPRQPAISGGSALRLPMTMDYHTEVRREGTAWIVEIGQVRTPAGEELRLSAERRPGEGTSILVEAREAAPVIPLVDAELGDTTFVVPTAMPGGVVSRMRQFPEFELLESAQGIAIHPLDERVRVASGPSAVRVFRPGGLTVSDPWVFAEAPRPETDMPRMLDLAAWQYGPAEDYQKIEQELLQYVIEPGGRRRNAARLGLARFYASHGMAAEALGVIDAMLREDPSMLRDAGIRALRGAARYMVGHYAEAQAEFDHPSLRNDRRLDPWRAGVAAARGDWRRAHRLFEDTDSVFNAYPTRFAVYFGLLATEASLSVDDLDTASVRLSVLEASPATGAQLDHAAFLRGHLLKKRDELNQAIELWQAVVAVGDRPSRAKATLALVNTRLEQGMIEPAEAIERLEQLRFAWRDDVFEFDMLHRLGQLYAENKDFRNALVTLRRAATYFKDIEGADALTDEMRGIFKTFYLEGDAEALAPIVALGLFNEFRELTPPGEQGDVMYRRLAERLIGVDLLDDAAELLDHQIRFRLEGEAKARVGARLADIRLMEGKPGDALAALKNSAVEPLSRDLADRRRRLEVRALSDHGDLAGAQRALGDDRTQEAQLLRAQILWRSGEWDSAALALAQITGPFDPEALDPRQAELLLRRAVALALAGDGPGLDYLRERFGAGMANTARAAAFAAVVGRKPLDTDDFAELARHATQLDSFTTFMNERPMGAGPAAAAPWAPPQTAEIN
jgi:tetratricopeptide (TPR) repeat protein